MRRSWARRSLQRRAATTGVGTTGAAGVGTGAGGMGTTEAAAFQVLDAIEEATGPGGVISVNGVADALGVDQPRASRLVARVVDVGLVRRGSDPDDGRRSILALTPRGARVLAEAHRTRRDAVEAALGGWSDEDRETFARLLRAYVTGWERAIGRRR